MKTKTHTSVHAWKNWFFFFFTQVSRKVKVQIYRINGLIAKNLSPSPPTCNYVCDLLCPSLCASLSVSLCVSVHLCMRLCPSLYASLSVSLFVSVFPFLCFYVPVCLCLPVSMSVSVCVRPSLRTPDCPSTLQGLTGLLDLPPFNLNPTVHN